MDFFDKNQGQLLQEDILTSGADSEADVLRDERSDEESHEQSCRPMTPEELLRMRMDILPQL